MTVPAPVEREFLTRLDHIAPHGLGLSVDVYSPDLGSLLGMLRQRQVFPDYLEVFRASPQALATVKAQAGGCPLPCHGEGLWLTEAGACENPLFHIEVRETARHLSVLGSAWLTHECATKVIAGYPYGTYVPPLYTSEGAAVVAENALAVQTFFDRACRLPSGSTPLLLLEMPPLTYFVAGTVSIPTFFRMVTDVVPCGLVLDVGHVWTVYRYSGAWRRMELGQFLREFLDEFPLHRVVQLHVAGLDIHESERARHAIRPLAIRPSDGADGADGELPSNQAWLDGGQDGSGSPVLPALVDAHGAPIPPFLFEMLDQILADPRLTNLRGVALEVDTKPIPLIAREFAYFQERYGGVCSRMRSASRSSLNPQEQWGASASDWSRFSRQEVASAYERYARVLAGQAEPDSVEWTGPTACGEELDRYRFVYLPHEILSWGGDVRAMFPRSCKQLDEKGISLAAFVSFWLSGPRPIEGPYDFFLVKIVRFVEFVSQVAPDLIEIACEEAEELRLAYDRANEVPVPAGGGKSL
ncbi:MAG: DUF692 domain-containing protein [Nitrospira sp.]|nr:DUF692 domain-containing protein [Nitrospira sp.]